MITICVPLFDPHEHFLIDFCEFYARNKERHQLRLGLGSLMGRQPMHRVQAAAVKTAQENGSSHILFTEDDHWRFPLDGLDVLLSAGRDAVGFATVGRKFPYSSLALERTDKSLSIVQTERKNMQPLERIDDEQPVVMKADVVSWAMHLVRTELFEKFEKDPFRKWGEVPTDSLFAHECEKIGVYRHVHFGCVLPHGDVLPEERLQLRQLHNYKLAVRKNPAAARVAAHRFKQFTPDLINAVESLEQAAISSAPDDRVYIPEPVEDAD